MKAQNKIIQQRLSVLQLAEALGNVSAACRQRGVSRSQFYEYKRRFQAQGIEGLKDLPPSPKATLKQHQKKWWIKSSTSPCNIHPTVVIAWSR